MIIGAPFVVYETQCNFVILVSERRAELSYAVLLGGFMPMHRRHFVVSRGQTAISAQGVYRLQYKRPRRKGSGRLHSADWVFTPSNVSIY